MGWGEARVPDLDLVPHFTATVVVVGAGHGDEIVLRVDGDARLPAPGQVVVVSLLGVVD